MCTDCDGRCSVAAGTKAELGNLTRFLTYHEHHGDRTLARKLNDALPLDARDWTGADLEALAARCLSEPAGLCTAPISGGKIPGVKPEDRPCRCGRPSGNQPLRMSTNVSSKRYNRERRPDLAGLSILPVIVPFCWREAPLHQFLCHFKINSSTALDWPVISP